MKFARLLRATAFEGMPQMETLFSAYKALKKKIKKLPPKEHPSQQQAAGPSSDTLTEEETEFVQALSDTLNQLNDTYIEKEENSVIRVERLESELAVATTHEQLNELHKQFVDFHGEVLLLVHWSILAYTATVKILKKHHKRTGLLVKAPQLGNLLSQPFCSTDLMTSIARRVEEDIQRLAERMGLPTQRASEPSHQQAIRHPTGQQGSEPLGTPSTTGAAAMAAAAALAAAAAAACSDTAAAGPSALAGAAAAAAAGAGSPMPAAVAAAAAAAGGAGGLPDHGLDLQLLRQLAADSGSGTSRSDDESAQHDTCASKQQQEQRQEDQQHQQRQRQEHQPCSQQAHLQQPAVGADEDHLEVQSAPKRRRVHHPSEHPVAAADGDATAAAAATGWRAPAPGTADAAGGAQGGSRQQWQRRHQQEEVPSPEHAAAAEVMLTHMCPSSAEHRVSCTGASPPSSHAQQHAESAAVQQQQQGLLAGNVQQAEAAAGVAAAAAAAGGGLQAELLGAAAGTAAAGEVGGDDGGMGSCGREASIMRQTQVALTTWRHLQSTASTPSTVMQGSAQPNYNASEAALTASSAVQ